MNKSTDLLLVLLVFAPALTLPRAPSRPAAAAAAGAGAGCSAAVVIAAGAWGVTGAAFDVAEHVVHESALLVDAVVVVARDVHLDQFWARVVCLRKMMTKIYRVSHLLVDWVGLIWILNVPLSTVCPILPGLMGMWQKCLVS